MEAGLGAFKKVSVSSFQFSGKGEWRLGLAMDGGAGELRSIFSFDSPRVPESSRQ